jgi:BCCIP
LAERIINMPAAVAAPSYKMLLEEIEWANEDVYSIPFHKLITVERTLPIH